MSDYNIWLIDDDPIQNKLNRSTISKVFSKTCKIESYTDPHNALGQLKERSVEPDFTFIDLDMPSMTGTEYINEVQKIGQSTPVVILSSSINGEVLEFAERCNLVYTCIHKPLMTSDLSFFESLSS